VRLEPQVRELAALGLDLRDWRLLPPEEIQTRFRGAREKPENRTLLANAIFVGTAQALVKGSYWAPDHACPGAIEVDCSHLQRPHSRFYNSEKLPDITKLERRSSGVRILCFPRCNPLDACAHVRGAGAESRRVAMVRFTGFRDPRNSSRQYRHCREDQLFLRTSYHQAYEKMESDINAPLEDAIDMGGLIYTPGVGVLRGPLDEGALWFSDPPRADVIWIGLLPRPQHAEQGQYALDKDKNSMVRMVDRIFAWAAYHEVDALVLPPLGCGTHGCHHPDLDVADIIHKAAQRYRNYISQVCVASDYPPHFEGGWWEAFADAVQHGRPAIERPVKIPVPPFPRLMKDSFALAEKAKRLNPPTRRTPRHTYL